MAINKVTLAKVLNKGTSSESVEYIYPKTSSTNSYHSNGMHVASVVTSFTVAAPDLDELDELLNEVDNNIDRLNSNKDDLDNLYSFINTQDDYNTIKKLVGLGFAQDAYPYGSTIKVTHSVLGDLIFEPVAYDYLFQSSSPSAHSMTIMMKNTTSTSFTLNSPEALSYVSGNIPTGLKYMRINKSASTGTYIVFTFNTTVPDGSRLYAGEFGSNGYPTSIVARSSTGTTVLTASVIQSSTIPGSGNPANLGTIPYNSAPTSVNLNEYRRAYSGGNNYLRSDINYYLTGSAPEYKFKYNGHQASKYSTTFEAGLPSDFSSIISPVSITYRTYSTFETDGLTKDTNYTFDAKYYLPSIAEINNGSTDGTVFPLYNGMTNAQRIKYDNNGTARAWATRSPSPSYSYLFRTVTTAGAISTSGSTYLSVACTICG